MGTSFKEQESARRLGNDEISVHDQITPQEVQRVRSIQRIIDTHLISDDDKRTALYLIYKSLIKYVYKRLCPNKEQEQFCPDVAITSPSGEVMAFLTSAEVQADRTQDETRVEMLDRRSKGAFNVVYPSDEFPAID